MKSFLIHLIKFYQKVFSPDRGLLVKTGFKKPSTCVFYPSCSEYTVQAIEKYGSTRGLFKGIKRVTRCHPWQKNNIDPLK
jgi:putative membrane protein insertion efficiency factor